MQSSLRWLVIGLVLCGVCFGIYRGTNAFGTSGQSDSDLATYTVQRRTIEDRVVEHGTVESQKTVFGKNQVDRSVKITFIVPEGTFVKKGEKVCSFETSEIDAQIKERKVELNTAEGVHAEAVEALDIQVQKNQTDIDAAKLEYDLAVIDLETYVDGTYVAERADLVRLISEGQSELEKVTVERKNSEFMVKKGYRTARQLKELQLREKSFLNKVERDRQKLLNLDKYTLKRQKTELLAKKRDGKRKLEATQKTAEAEVRKAKAAIANAKSGVELLQSQLDERVKMLENCTLLAGQDGTVAYANERWYDDSRRIREGTEVYSGRNVYFLPDMKRMQVKAKIHESVVDRVKKDQKAGIRLEAFSDRILPGTVKSVAGMASSSYSSVQNYDTVILVDELPEDLEIKPGMSAEVDILVDTYRDVLAVPVGAITEHFSQTYVYVVKGGEVERRKVETDRTTHSFVEVAEGLSEGEVVALDAYQRGLADFADKEREASTAAPPPPGAGPPA